MDIKNVTLKKMLKTKVIINNAERKQSTLYNLTHTHTHTQVV